MNKAIIRRVAVALLNAKLAAKDIGYNQSVFRDDATSGTPDRSGHNCGTVACIAGYTTALFRPHQRRHLDITARKILGITADIAYELFRGSVPLDHEPTAAEAALVLFNLAETGKVDWKIAA